MELDTLDQLAAKTFDGYIVRKDLALRFKGQYPVPTYVGEFLLGRYCASTNEAEIAEGLGIVEYQMRDRTVRPGEEELFKSRARERGSIKLIDLITARLDTETDSYVARLPSLRLTDVRIDAELVAENERMLWPEVGSGLPLRNGSSCCSAALDLNRAIYLRVRKISFCCESFPSLSATTTW